MNRKALEIIGQPPIACSLAPEEQDGRAEEWRELARSALRRKEPTDNGIRLHFEIKAEEAVRELSRLEKQCCPFFEFAYSRSADEFVLEVTCPPEARPILETLV